MHKTFLALALMLASVTGALAGDAVVITGFARASTTPKAASGAAYLTLINHGAADRLLSISTTQARVAQLHESRSADGVMSMQMVPVLDLPPGVAVAMKPGGLHIMLMGLRAPLIRGDKIILELTFEKAGKLSVEVPIGGVAQASGN